jgi:hypothetical protein
MVKGKRGKRGAKRKKRRGIGPQLGERRLVTRLVNGVLQVVW